MYKGYYIMEVTNRLRYNESTIIYFVNLSYHSAKFFV